MQWFEEIIPDRSLLQFLDYRIADKHQIRFFFFGFRFHSVMLKQVFGGTEPGLLEVTGKGDLRDRIRGRISDGLVLI